MVRSASAVAAPIATVDVTVLSVIVRTDIETRGDGDDIAPSEEGEVAVSVRREAVRSIESKTLTDREHRRHRSRSGSDERRSEFRGALTQIRMSEERHCGLGRRRSSRDEKVDVKDIKKEEDEKDGDRRRYGLEKKKRRREDEKNYQWGKVHVEVFACGILSYFLSTAERQREG